MIDPYNLTESELSSSSDEGEAGETEWESASRGDGGDADEDDDEPLSDGEAERDVEGRDGAVVRLMLEREYGKAPAGTGSRSVAGARSAAARSNAAPRSNAGGRSVAGARIVAGARSVVGGRSFAARSVATVATEADGSPASGAGRGPTAQPLKTGLDARLEGKAVQRRLQRRRGWSFNLQQDEVGLWGPGRRARGRSRKVLFGKHSLPAYNKATCNLFTPSCSLGVHGRGRLLPDCFMV